MVPNPLSLFLVTLSALAPLFLLIALGYGLKRGRVLHAAHVPVLNGLVVNVTVPALVVRTLATAPHMPAAYVRLPLALILAQCGVMALASGTGRLLRLPRPTLGAVLLVATFGNTAFLGYPIALALLPREFPAAVLTDQFGMTIMLYICGALVGAGFGRSDGGAAARTTAILRFLRGPIFLSLVVGLAARLVPWPRALLAAPPVHALGAALGQCLTYLGQGTTPLVLLALGVALRPGAALAAPKPVALACALKLLACPLLMYALCRAFALHGDLLAVGVLQGAMPTAVIAGVLSAQNDMEGDLAVGIVCLSTIGAGVTIPLLLSLLR